MNTSQAGRTKLGMGSPQFLAFTASIPPSSRETIDEALKVLHTNKEGWVALSISERIGILDTIRQDLMAVANRWVATSLYAKGIPAQTFGEGVEWALLAVVFRALRALRQSLDDIRQLGRPRIPYPLTMHQNGQVVAQVFPQTTMDKILFMGITGEVWMEPGLSSQDVVNTQAQGYREKTQKGKIALVLGAGNASSLPAVDSLYKLFIENRVVILKMNPVNAYLSPFMEEAFRVLIQRGVLRLIQGGAAEGNYVCHHPAVNEIHLTGSDKTFEAILFGSGSEGAIRKEARTPVLHKRVTAELGNVSPVIIVPGPWSHEEIKEQAVQLATMLVAGTGCFCMTPRVIVQHKSWSQRKTFLKVLGEVLSNVQTHKAYYPNANARYAAFVTAHPNASRFGKPGDDSLPWTLITDVDPDNSDDICFKSEAFCSLFAETALEAPNVPEFIDHAVQFANETLWGTLAATIIVHPKSLEHPQTRLAVDQAITKLRYGTIAVNLFAAYGHYFMLTPWGGYPGQDIYDVQSGVGWTNNVLMFQRPQKSVYHAPFRKTMDPLTVTSKCAHEFGKKLAHFDAFPSVWRLSSIMGTALRS